MHYISTRGQAPTLNFEQVLLTGLASDGGLYVPSELPHFGRQEIARWQGLSYDQLALQIIRPFVGDCIAEATLQAMLSQTYASFAHKAVAPLQQLQHNEFVQELFHGPTLAFKDFALQLLGRLFDHVLTRRQQRVVIMGATSGDTGSAAIEGCRHSQQIDLFILHPYQRVSTVQRRQMTTVLSDRIHNIAIRGHFDDCQHMVKQSFLDQSFLPADRPLAAVNSINWARIMAQIVYYFYAALHLGGPDREVAFCVPTGNFGDIFAGYLAHKMGLPIHRLIIATNKNDILHRLLQTGIYAPQPLQSSLSPSMDIVVSSNFERLLFDLYQRDGVAVSQLMQQMKDQPQVSLSPASLQQARQLFSSARVDDAQICAIIQQVHQHSAYLLDPHTATGVHALRSLDLDPAVPKVVLATAHPAKFEQAIRKAGLPSPALPAHLQDLLQKEEAYQVIDNDLAAVQAYMAQCLQP